MLRVDRDSDIVRDNRASTDRAHDADQNVSRPHSVATQGFVLRLRDVPGFSPREVVPHDVVDPQDWNALVDELAVEESAAEWAGPDRAGYRRDKICHRNCWVAARPETEKELFGHEV